MKKFKKLSQLLLISTGTFLPHTTFADGIFTAMDGSFYCKKIL